MGRLLNPREAAKIIGKSVVHTRRLMRLSSKSLKVGSNWAMDIDDLKKLKFDKPGRKPNVNYAYSRSKGKKTKK